jgi:N-acetylglucosaminyl-diphospho-decaprenol L-rhamnosyltransferase
VSRIPDLRLGIVTYDTPDDLASCLEALPAATAGLDVEVVVVDNGSVGDGDLQVARQFPVRVLQAARNVGYPRAMNRALADTAAPVLMAVNPDTLAEPGSLTHLVEALQRAPDVGLMGPLLRGQDGHVQHSGYAFPSPAVALATGLVPPRLRPRRLLERYDLEGWAPRDRPHEVDWLVGAVHCIRAAAVRRDRVYSERAFMYVEDLELGWHVRRSGFRVVLDPAVQVLHIGNVTGERSFGAQRELRWIDATYDWYVEARGAAAARRWAVANVLGLSAKALLLARSDDAAHRSYVGELLGEHRRRVRNPRGDQHSRLTPDGQVPPDVEICLDEGPRVA